MAALDGIRVVELGQIFNGPYCGLMLAFLGAEVIKVEPLRGDRLRSNGRGGVDPHEFVMLNSNKSSIALDLKAEEGRELFLELCARADVVIENYKNGVMEGLGLGWELLHARNPRLVYADGKGYGREGPYADYPAMDVTVQAMAGVMAITGFPDQPPVKAGIAVADFMGGIHLAAGVLAALLERERSGLGQRVEVAMHDTMYTTLASALGTIYNQSSRPFPLPERTGNRHIGLALAPYNVYPAADGHVAIFCVSPEHWTALVKLIDRPELAAGGPFERYSGRLKRMDELDAIISAWTAPQPKWQIVSALLAVDVPAAPVLSLREVAEDPHLRARGMVRDVEHPGRGVVPVPGNPIRLEHSPLRELRPAPLMGEHTDAVLRSLGLDDERIAGLRERKVIG